MRTDFVSRGAGEVSFRTAENLMAISSQPEMKQPWLVVMRWIIKSLLIDHIRSNRGWCR